MAVVGWRETIRGAKVSGKFGESFTYGRTFLIRVDHPATPITSISRAPGIVFGAPHPAQPACRAMEFECSPADDVGLWWQLSVSYYVPETKPDADGIPEDIWAAGGSVSTGPVFEDIAGEAIANTAGDALEGLERENDDISWTLTKCFNDMSWQLLRVLKSNTVNNATWQGGEPGTWKVNFRGATKKEITTTTQGNQAAAVGQAGGDAAPFDGEEGTVTYWETTWEFRYRAGGWALKPWNVGFNQIQDGYKVAILDDDGKPVSQPVALTSQGEAQLNNVKPITLEFDIYGSSDFASSFGEPS